MQDEAALAIHRAAAQHRLRGDGRVARLEVHLFEDLAERHGQRFVDDDAERTFVGGVFADQRD